MWMPQKLQSIKVLVSWSMDKVNHLEESSTSIGGVPNSAPIMLCGTKHLLRIIRESIESEVSRVSIHIQEEARSLGADITVAYIPAGVIRVSNSHPFEQGS